MDRGQFVHAAKFDMTSPDVHLAGEDSHGTETPERRAMTSSLSDGPVTIDALAYLGCLILALFCFREVFTFSFDDVHFRHLMYKSYNDIADT